MTKTTSNQPTIDTIDDAEIVEEPSATLPALHDPSVGLYDPSLDEWAGVDDGDMTGDVGGRRIPRIRSNMKYGYGWAPTDSDTWVPQLEFVWLAKGRSRVLFPAAYDADNKPLCRSGDGLTADPDSPDLRNGGDCTTCPHRLWNGDTPPECSESIEALVFLASHNENGLRVGGQLRRLRFSGMALGPARDYWDSFGLSLPKRPPMSAWTVIYGEPRDTANGKFLVPHFEQGDPLARSAAQPLIAEREQRMADWRADITDDTRDGVGRDQADAARDAGTDTEPF